MEKCTIKIGLCMAGAVSAGAYSAGVLDYLFDVLDSFYAAKESDKSLQNIDIKIEVMGGASAGGMLAAICALYVHLREPDQLLKNLWVDMTADDMLAELMSTEDLLSGTKAKSILNSAFIDKLAKPIESSFEKMVRGEIPVYRKPYMSDTFDVFMTLFNLSGLQFSFSVQGDQNIHGKEVSQFLTEHRDLAVFTCGKVYEKDGKMPIFDKSYPYFRTFIQAAKATGAFPFGLSTRMVTRRAQVIRDLYEKLDLRYKKAGLSLNLSHESDIEISTINADGGTANNEPLDFLKTLMSTKVEDNEFQINLLIDPFPAFFDTSTAITENDVTLTNLLLPFVFSLKNQLIFDNAIISEVSNKPNKNSITRMIAPKETGRLDKYALHSSAFGGFGGFIHKSFRLHDYQLGRKNCQKFLRTQLVFSGSQELSSDNTLVNTLKEAYLNSNIVSGTIYRGHDGKEYIPYIPDLTQHDKQIVDVAHSLPSDFFDAYRSLLKKRLLKLSGKLFDPMSSLNLIGQSGILLFGNSLTESLFNHFESELKIRGLMEE